MIESKNKCIYQCPACKATCTQRGKLFYKRAAWDILGTTVPQHPNKPAMSTHTKRKGMPINRYVAINK